MLVADNCTLLLGEDRHTDLAAAYETVGSKRVDLSGMHYGPLESMLGYAAMVSSAMLRRSSEIFFVLYFWYQTAGNSC